MRVLVSGIMNYHIIKCDYSTFPVNNNRLASMDYYKSTIRSVLLVSIDFNFSFIKDTNLKIKKNEAIIIFVEF
jgi:hypothetical protein